MIELVTIVPVLLAAAGAAAVGWSTLTKLRTRRDLAIAIQKHPADLAEVHMQLEAKDLDAATAVIRKHLGELSQAERREAETALAQPSAAGRTQYIRDLSAT